MKPKRCLAITWTAKGLPRACGEKTRGEEFCPHHAAMFVMLAPRAPEKAVQR